MGFRDGDAARPSWGVFWVGIVSWLAASAIHWPATLTLFDEVGYVGQARMLIDGRARPAPDSVCLSYRLPSGEIARYPLFLPALIAPLFAVSPRLVFLPGFAASVLLATLCAIALARWRLRPAWGLVVLVHPTVVIFSRTVMIDILLSAFAVGAWLALENRRRSLAAVAFALLVIAKPTGIAMAAFLLIGQAIRLRLGPEAVSAAAPRRQWRYAAVGTIAGLAIAGALNVVSTGGPGYSYAYGTAGFTLAALRTSGAAHALSLSTLPPLLIAGVWPFVKRREYGPVLATCGLTVLMSLYSFVDTGRGRLEDVVLSPRLILPSVAFLLIGYAELWGRLLQRPRSVVLVTVGLLVSLPVLSVIVGTIHADHTATDLQARRLAESIVSSRHGTELGLSYGAFKAGLLSPLPVRWSEGSTRPSVVILCSKESTSYRDPVRLSSCVIPGYDVLHVVGPYRVLALRHEEARYP